MSHLPGQPLEVPYREVDHDHLPEADPIYPDYWPATTGKAEHDLMGWTLPTEAEKKRWAKELADRERRRLPFGFQAARAILEP